MSDGHVHLKLWIKPTISAEMVLVILCVDGRSGNKLRLMIFLDLIIKKIIFKKNLRTKNPDKKLYFYLFQMRCFLTSGKVGLSIILTKLHFSSSIFSPL